MRSGYAVDVVMSDRPEVRTASWPIAAVDVAGLASNLVGAVAVSRFAPLGVDRATTPRNLAVSTTRELTRSLLGYAASLPIDEFRALERVMDAVSGQALLPFVACRGSRSSRTLSVACPDFGSDRQHPGARGGAPEAVDSPGTILYLHGGGYIGTSPRMYALFMAHLARVTGCAVFAADYRLAPEYPFPAAADDILAVASHLVAGGLAPERLILAGDSGGGGLVGTVLHRISMNSQKRPAAVLLFSPEVSLTLSEDSIIDNAPLDILPWNIPVNSYLHGIDPDDQRVDVLLDDLSGWPPTFLVYGADEIFRDAIGCWRKSSRLTVFPTRPWRSRGCSTCSPFCCPGLVRAVTRIAERVSSSGARWHSPREPTTLGAALPGLESIGDASFLMVVTPGVEPKLVRETSERTSCS